MEIIKTNATTRAEQYKLTRSETVKMSDYVGEDLSIKAYCIYKDFNADGIEQKIVTILGIDGTIYGTNSNTFTSKFEEMLDFFEDDGGVGIIKVLGGKTKAGRDYISCDYVGGVSDVAD